jgi:serine/threonine-protein kinase
MNRCARCSGAITAFVVFCPHCAQALEPNFDQLINLIIDGRYRIYRRLGQGGLSTIFAATDLETDNVVAIKISDPSEMVRREMSYAIDATQARGYWDEMLERMRREAETLTDLDHPNIVRFFGTGLINEDLRYVAMEFLRGRTLRDEIDRGRIISSKPIAITLEVASALSAVHARGIVHRDINPRNIFICKDVVKLIDFGIAKFPQPPGAPPFTQHSALAGTVAYASPEQCASHPVDHRSDIYSLGVVVYEMVTGQRPFHGRTPTEIALKQIQSEPKPPRVFNPSISASLERTILRALAKNPEQRQQSVEEFANELQLSFGQIVIPLPAADATDQADITLSRNGSLPADGTDEEAESGLKAVRKRRRRFVVTSAAALTAAGISAALFAWPSLSSRLKSPDRTGVVEATALSSPGARPSISSDADSLELAANMSSQKTGQNTGVRSAVNAAPTSVPNSGGRLQQPQQEGAVPTTANARQKALGRKVTPPTPSPAPLPIPPKARPQMPPSPSPTIEIARAPQPASEPDLAQAPTRDQDNDTWRSKDKSERDRNSNNDAYRDSDREEERDSYRRRSDEDNFGMRRRPLEPQRRQESNRDETDRYNRDGDDEDESFRIGPKLYQWSGRVNQEREITIEMPGVPGTVEIPRGYRDRVGIVEPPNANNHWRCAVLRVFGRGGVSIVVRWWPVARNIARTTARR